MKCDVSGGELPWPMLCVLTHHRSMCFPIGIQQKGAEGATVMAQMDRVGFLSLLCHQFIVGAATAAWNHWQMNQVTPRAKVRGRNRREREKSFIQLRCAVNHVTPRKKGMGGKRVKSGLPHWHFVLFLRPDCQGPWYCCMFWMEDFTGSCYRIVV